MKKKSKTLMGKTQVQWGNFFVMKMCSRMNDSWAWSFENENDDPTKYPGHNEPLVTLDDVRDFTGKQLEWKSVMEHLEELIEGEGKE